MRGAKAKELRRLAKRKNLPDTVYARDTTIIEVPTPLHGTFRVAVGTRVLGPCEKAFTKRAKRRIGNRPIVGAARAIRRMVTEIQNKEST